MKEKEVWAVPRKIIVNNNTYKLYLVKHSTSYAAMLIDSHGNNYCNPGMGATREAAKYNLYLNLESIGGDPYFSGSLIPDSERQKFN